MNITKDSQKKAMLLHYVGEETCDILETLNIPEPSEGTDVFEVSVKALAEYFEPQKCIDHHVYVFRQQTQKTGENVNEFYTRLQLLARKCEFSNQDIEVKRQIIQGTSSLRLRRKAIEQSLSLEELLKSARAMETANEQTSEMEKQQSHAVGNYNFINRQSKFKKTFQSKKQLNKTKCGLCGGNYPHTNKCPAHGKSCHKCGKLNHFSKVCRSKASNSKQSTGKHHIKTVAPQDQPVEAMHVEKDDSDNSEEYTFTTVVQVNQIDKPIFEVQISNTVLNVMADSGATVNILSEHDFNSLNPKPQLSDTKTKVYPYMSKNPLNLKGKFHANVKSGLGSAYEVFYVAKGSASSILSWSTSQKLNLIKVVKVIDRHDASLSSNIPEVLKQYPSLMNRMGEYKGTPVRIHVDELVKPIASPHRRIPFHVRKQVERKLEQLESEGIIERAEGPTPWVSPIVVVPKPHKPNEIRICVDMRALNKAIIRERHVIPTIDDVVHDLNGCTVFSKIDLNQGYHQIPLHPDSKPLTTFSTHVGLFRYKRLNFGLSCAAEIFQKKVSDAICGIPCVKNISDDIYVGGVDNEDHDRHLDQLLRRLQENGLTINLPKCQFRVPTMLFFGHVFSENGLSPDPKKVEALQRVAPPTNASEVRSLLSSASFCSRFIKDFAGITRPLRRLTCAGVKWLWSEAEQYSFESLKAALSAKTTLAYYDPNKPISIFLDGSPVGLGAVLTQEDLSTKETTALHYASCPLTPTQARYPQIDREALSIYWAIKRFHLFVYGTDFKVITDHKPLVSLFNNPSSKPSARIERWLLDLQQYRFTVEYRPGPSNPADYASRHPVGDAESRKYEAEAEAHVAFVARNAVPKAVTLSEIEAVVANDPTLQAVMSAVKSGIWHKAPDNVSLSELSRYEKIKEQLTCTETLLLKSDRIFVPAALQERIIDIAHEGHLGMVKTKALLREKVWFPCMDKMVENKIKSCLPCQVVTPIYNREPLKMSVLPDNPFDEVSIDFASVNGETLLLVIDDHSRFPFVEPVSSTSANVVIPKLDKLFAMFGTPHVVRSDNGPPFNGEEFAKFAQVLGFKHRRVTPLWPRANGEVERFVKTLKKYIKAAKTEGKNWRKEMQSFLRNYRTTPHATTGVAPSVLLMKRVARNKIPQTNNVDPVSEIIRRYDSSQKAKIKAYAEQKSYVKPCDITLGDPVLVKRPFVKSKGMSVYNPNPMMVVKVKGSMITAKNADTTVSRNSSFFKKLTGMIPCEENDTDLVSKHQKEFPNQPYNPKVNIPDLTSSKHQKESPSQPHNPKVNIPDLAPSTSESRIEGKDPQRPQPKDSTVPGDQDHGNGTARDIPEVPQPVNEPQTVNEPPPLRRSTRRRIPRKMLDL